MPEISVIVCARNEEGFLTECLSSLRAQTLKPEIIVVDGHSIDKTVTIAKKFADKVVLDNKKGLGDARNIGVKVAKGEIIAFCDADCRPKSDWTMNIKRLLLDSIAVSGPVVPYDGGLWLKLNVKIWGGIVPRIFSFFGVKSLWGANMAYKREILMKTPFRLRFLEDFDMLMRLSKIGKIRFSNSMAMPASTRRFKNGFYRIILKYYIPDGVNIILGRPTGKGYY